MGKEVTLTGMYWLEKRLELMNYNQGVANEINVLELKRKIINDMLDKNMITHAGYADMMHGLYDDVLKLRTH